MHELAQERAFRDATIRASFHVRLEERAGDFDLGDVQDYRSALLAFRRFTAPGEDVHFEPIANLVEQHISDQTCRANVRQLREDWKAARAGGGGITVRGEALDGFDLVVNGEIFHDDAAKEAKLLGLDEMIRGLLRYNTAHFLLHGSQVLWAFKNNLVATIPERIKAAESP